MRILINGYYVGGNSSPFVIQLKQLGHEVKLYDVGYFSHTLPKTNEAISEKDLFFNKIPRPFVFTLKILKKLRIPLWKKIVLYKAKKIIMSFKPNIIINHQLNKRAEIMLKTNFEPQIGIVFGGELRNKRFHSRAFKKILDKSLYVYATVEESINKLNEYYPEYSNKYKIAKMGLGNYYDLINFDKSEINSLRSKYGLSDNDIVFYDDRSSRDEKAFTSILETISHIKAKLRKYRFKLLLLRGHGGSDTKIATIKKVIKRMEIDDLVILVNEVVSMRKHLNLIKLSDCVVSLLSYDQLGFVITEGMLLQKKLLLFDLPQYRRLLGDNAVYCTDYSIAQLSQSILNVINNYDGFAIKNNLQIAKEQVNPENNIKKFEKELLQITSNT